jgi:hypothetical protein
MDATMTQHGRRERNVQDSFVLTSGFFSLIPARFVAIICALDSLFWQSEQEQPLQYTPDEKQSQYSFKHCDFTQ